MCRQSASPLTISTVSKSSSGSLKSVGSPGVTGEILKSPITSTVATILQNKKVTREIRGIAFPRGQSSGASFVCVCLRCLL